MLLQELKDRAYQLPIRDRLELIEAIVGSLKTEKIAATAIANDPNRTEKLKTSQKIKSAIEKLRGIAKTDSPPPTDTEVKEMLAERRINKYLG
ncbi:hypothetical protein [Spirulina sp. 06S082]|uniref:hypothetical protein n=1 Tax=Spirulina sp. 06S082 TaxID=3110248 RepID=UPI002B219174|nr:hypothetical protein [Spirulina sp. 06S082]MEA5472416.1 hypothetical protein [Spirulina sp. 06S082]